MKFVKFFALSTMALALIAGCGESLTASPSSAELQVTETIGQMPAETSQQRDALASELVELNPQATLLLAKMLLPPTDPNDNAARYGLSALTHYTSRPGAEAERAVYAAALIKALPDIPEKQNQAFLISQLQLVGKDEAIEPLGAFLNDDVLADYAARALLSIHADGTEKVFLKALDSANDTNKATILHALGQLQSRTAAEQLPPAGFTSLFNGTGLHGWKCHEGLPGEKKPTGKWFVEDGAIIGVQDPPGKGGFLTTTESYRDFELQLETKIDWPFDTGIFLRVGPDGKSHQVTLDYRDGGEIGGIYCPWTQGFVHHCPDGIKHFKKDQWNKLRIVCVGQPARIQVWLNGTQITDFQHTEKTTEGIPEEGTICLQIHPGGKGYDESQGRFRNIFVRRLDNAEKINNLTEQEKAEGFVSLFNGTDLTGWIGSTESYGVKDGILFCRKGTGRNIFTEKEYDNFVLRFEFKLEPGTNNGLGIRTPTKGDPAYVGMELQILDNTHKKYSNLHDWQYHGSVYGIIAADDKLRYSAFKPVGQWNTEEVIANGDHITVKVNGKTIVDGNIREAIKKDGPLSGKKHPGLFNETGHIGFLGHGDYIEFRNLRIKEL